MLQVTKYWSKNHDLMFILPSLGYKFCKESLLGKTFVYNSLLEKEMHGTFNILILYSMRILRTILLYPKTYFDVVIASSHYPCDVIPALFHHLRNPKCHLVVYLHGILVPTDKLLTSLFSTIYNLLGLLFSARCAHLIFVINSPTRKYLLHQGVESARVVVTTNGVETKEVASLKSEKTFDACFLGRLVKNKGIFDLISVWKEICSTRPSARLALLGDGSEKELLKELVAKAGLEKNIILLGFVSEDEKRSLLRSSQVFVFPSYLESWGISIVEAMACGLPVVAYNLPVYNEVFENKLITVPLGDVDAMAKQVGFLLENLEVARDMGEANKEFVKRYDWSVVAEQELSEIMKLIGGNSLCNPTLNP